MQANTLILLVFSALFAGNTGWANAGFSDPFSAQRYYSTPSKFIGEKVKLRIFRIEPRPKLTAADLGHVWFQASTDRDGTEASKIHVRVEQEEVEKFVRNFQTENRSGRLVDGIFASRSSSTDLSPEVSTQVPFYLVVGKRAEIRQATGEIISGSLVVVPSPRRETKAEKEPAAGKPVKDVRTLAFAGPKLILVRSGTQTSLHLREAAKVETKPDVLEVLAQDGSLQSVIGRSSVVAVLPAPTGEVTREKAVRAVELYEEVLARHPEAEPLLTEAHQKWKKIAAEPLVTASL